VIAIGSGLVFAPLSHMQACVAGQWYLMILS
jgi:hypothetical protein